MALKIGFAAGAVLVIALLAFDVRAWRCGDRRISRRHKGLRIASAAVIVVILGMMFFGDRIHRYGTTVAFSYWMACMGLVCLLLLLVLMDFREVARVWGQAQKDLNKLLAAKDMDDHKDE